MDKIVFNLKTDRVTFRYADSSKEGQNARFNKAINLLKLEMGRIAKECEEESFFNLYDDELPSQDEEEPRTRNLREGKPETQESLDKYIDSGKRVVKGVMRYRCRYHCDVCKATGNHYIPKGLYFVSCHRCKVDLDVSRIETESGKHTHDDYGNWYVAGNQAPYFVDSSNEEGDKDGLSMGAQ